MTKVTNAPRHPSHFTYTREESPYQSEDARCAGWLYLPEGVESPPVVVLAPDLGAERSFGNPAFAERFVERGMAAFLFDYRNFGASHGIPRHLIDPTRQIADLRAAIRHVQTLDEVDGNRMALWGTGLGGGHVVAVAADEHDVEAVVAQVPFLDGRASARDRGVGYVARGLVNGLRDRAGSLFRRSPTDVPIVAGPGEFGLLAAPGAKNRYLSLIPPRSRWQNRAPARSVISLMRYRPVSTAGHVTVPTLLVSTAGDRVTPAKSVDIAAGSMSDATIVRVPGDHFDVFRDRFEDVVGYESAFLKARLFED